MTRTDEFNQNLYYLGAVCKYNHVFSNTNNSLRQKSNRTCLACQKNTKQKYKQTHPELCNERTRKWREKIAEKQNKLLPAKKQCNTCLEWKTGKEFYVEKYSAGGLLGHCIACDKKRQDVYRARRRKPRILKDPELIKENRRKIKSRYKKTIKGKLANTKAQYRRRTSLRQNEVKNYTPTQILLRFAEFGNKCAYCGESGKISIDHFVPISKFGADSLENIVPACIRCSSSKNNKSPEKWFKTQPFFSMEKWLFLINKVTFQAETQQNPV